MADDENTLLHRARLDLGAIMREYFSREDALELRERMAAVVRAFVAEGHIMRRQNLSARRTWTDLNEDLAQARIAKQKPK